VILFLYVARKVLGATLLSLAGVVGVFLAVDFVDAAARFSGPGVVGAVLELYANKAAVVAYQVAPAALLLGAAIAVSGLRQTREWTALRAVGLGPWRVAAPVLAVSLLFAIAGIVLYDAVGVRAAERVEEIQALRFGRGEGRYLAWREPKRWFRGEDGRRVYQLRGLLPTGGFERVTVYELSPQFELARRIDAVQMVPGADRSWTLQDVEIRTFLPEGELSVERAQSRTFRFPEPPEAFAVAPGRPAQLRWSTLIRQLAIRKQLGLPSAPFALERYNRLAYPLAGVPGVLVAMALALRRERKGNIAAALLEAVGVSLLIWSAQGITWAMGLSGRVTPAVAAWAPNVIFLVVGVYMVRRVR
jgi:lipopolysaccharide export system permease protein